MVRPDGGIGRRNGLKIRCPKRTCGFDPRSGYHNNQQVTAFYSTKNPLQRPNGEILFASSRYLLITRILGYFWDIKFKSVAFGKIPQNDHKSHSSPQRYLTVKKRDTVLSSISLFVTGRNMELKRCSIKSRKFSLDIVKEHLRFPDPP